MTKLLFLTALAVLVNSEQRNIRGRRKLLFDPKTVETKRVLPTVQEEEAKLEQQASSVHTTNRISPVHGVELIKDYPLVRDHPENDLTKDLRYVTFGSSHVWGSGVDKEKGREFAFPYLLSKNVTNLAIPAHDLGYPALCLNAIIEEDAVFDVAIIFHSFLQPWAPDDSSTLLAKGLQERFPDIIIIIVNHLYPLGIIWNGKDGNIIGIRDWEKQENAGVKTDPYYISKMKQYEENHDGAWDVNFRYYKSKDLEEYGQKMQENLGENTFFIDFLKDFEHPYEYLQQFGDYTCDTDYHHPCHVGHRNYADAMQQLIQQVRLQQHQNSNPQEARVAPWRVNNQCVSWFEAKKTPEEVPKASDYPNMSGFRYNCFTADKCSMELVEKQGSFTITNTDTVNEYLAITFMAVTEHHPDIHYPRVQIELVAGDGTNLGSFVADTITREEAFLGKMVHIDKLLNLPTLPPGETQLRFTSLDPEQPNPFRFVSYLLTERKADFRGIVTK